MSPSGTICPSSQCLPCFLRVAHPVLHLQPFRTNSNCLALHICSLHGVSHAHCGQLTFFSTPSNSVKALGAYDTYINQRSTYIVQVPALQKKDLLFWQDLVYFSSDLQLIISILEESLVIASYGQYSAHAGVATRTTERFTRAGSLPRCQIIAIGIAPLQWFLSCELQCS